MKILFINCIFYPFRCSGAEKIILQLSQSLVVKGNDVRILTLTNNKYGSTDEIDGVKVDRIPIKNLYLYEIGINKPFFLKFFWHLINIYNLLYGFEIKNYLKKFKPDIVNTHNITGFTPSIFKIIKNSNIPVIHTIHDQYLLCFKCTMFDKKLCDSICIKCKFLKFNYKNFIAKVDHFVGVSKFITNKHIALGYFNKKNSSTIQNIVFRQIKFNDKKSSLSKDHIKFGYIGTLNKDKGIVYLLKQISRIINSNSIKFNTKFTFSIAGSGEEKIEKYIIDSAKKYQCIQYKGFVNPDFFFPSIDVLIVPSLWEDTFPTVILEAFAYNIPVIGSKLGGIPELVIDNYNGFLFDPDNGKSNDLSKILLSLIKDPLLIEKAKKNISINKNNKNQSEWINQYIGLFEKVIKSNSK